MNKRTKKWFLLLFALLLPSLGWAQSQTIKENGLIFTFDTDHYVLTGNDANEFDGQLYIPYDICRDEFGCYQVTKLNAGALDGLTNIKSVNFWAEVDEIPADFFKGIGSQTDPIDAYFNWEYLSRMGGILSNQVCQLAGGFFNVFSIEGGDGLDIIYKLISDQEFWLTDIRLHDFEPDSYQLNIYTERWWNDQQTLQLTKVLPEATAKLANVANKISRVSIYGSVKPEIDANAFAGIGKANAPVDLVMFQEDFINWGGNTSTGQLLGGYFSLMRSEWGGENLNDGFYRLTSDGYVLSDPIEYQEDADHYTLHLVTQFDDINVVEIKANAFKDIRQNISNMNFTSISFDGENTNIKIEEGAFTGFGTDDNPIDMNISTSLLQKIGEVTAKGNYKIAGGYFRAGVIRDYDDFTLTYVANENNGYTLAKVVEKDSQNNPKTLDISSFIDDRNDNGEYVQIPVTAIAENALEGIGSAEAPVRLNMYKSLAKNLGAKTENGLTTLAGGVFELGYVYCNEGVNIFYKMEDDGQSYTVKGYTQDIWWMEENPEGYKVIINSEIGDENGTEWVEGIPVTKIAANAFKDIKDVYAVSIEGSAIDIGDGAFTGIGTAEKPASLTASNAILKDALDNKLAEGVYNIKGGIFALNAITIKAQKNPENQNYAITYAFVDNTEVVALREEDDGTGNWKPVPGTYILMDAPADGSDYYTYTFLSAKQIMNLRLAMIDENNNPYTEVYYNYDELNIASDTTFVWNADKNRLLLKGAPEEYGIMLGDTYVTAANAGDILANDETNAGKAKYDVKTNTLTLDGVDIQGWGQVFYNRNDGLTVVLKGQNTFRPQKNEPDAFVEFFNGGQMTITGNGTLNLICSNKEITETNGNWGNIYDFNLTITGGATLNASRTRNFNANILTVEKGTLNISEVKEEYALQAYNLTLGEGIKIMIPKDGKTNEDGILCDADGNYAKTVKIDSEAGDANSDGKVDATDIVEVVNHLMGKASEKYNPSGADANKDGTVNAADIVTIVNIISNN